MKTPGGAIRPAFRVSDGGQRLPKMKSAMPLSRPFFGSGARAAGAAGAVVEAEVAGAGAAGAAVVVVAGLTAGLAAAVVFGAAFAAGAALAAGDVFTAGLAAAVLVAGAVLAAGFAAALLAGAAAFAAGAVADFAVGTAFAVDLAAGFGLEAAVVLDDAVDGDLAMYSPTPRLKQTRPDGQEPGACVVVSIRDDSGVC